MKRTITAGIALLLLILMVTASASTAGSSSDPLITLLFLNGEFTDALKLDISRTYEIAAGDSISRLDALYTDFAGFSFAQKFISISLAQDDMVMLSTGSSFILLSGSAKLSVSSGAVINVSSGRETASGSQLSRNQRYFCTENTTAIISADSELIGQVDGLYLVRLAKPNRPHPIFKDVMELDWFYSAVDYVYNNGLFGGTSPGIFSPALFMTRGMFVTVLYRLDGEPITGQSDQFSDVLEPAQYYYQAVVWANASNIVRGYPDGTFRPNDPVTREQIAAIMYRYAEYADREMSTPGSISDAFPDTGDVSEYALAAMAWAVSRNVINGSNGKLLPQDTATRAQVAQIVSNYVENIR